MSAILEVADAFVGVPYKRHGRTPVAWDCLGCAGYLRGHLFQRRSPSCTEVYPASDGLSAARLAEFFEREMRMRLSAWRPASRAPGVLVALTLYDRVAHVGLVLTPQGDFIHALEGAGTAVESLDGPRWRTRIRGYFDAD